MVNFLKVKKIFFLIFIAIFLISLIAFADTIPDPVIQYNQTDSPYIVIGDAPSGNYNDLNILGEGLTYDIPEAQDGNTNITLLYDDFEGWATGSDCSPGTLPVGSWTSCLDTADTFIRGTSTAGEYNNGTKALTLYDWDSDNFPDTEALVWCGDTSSYTSLYLTFWWRRIALDTPGEYGRVSANKTGTSWTNIFDTGNGADTNYAESQIDITSYISTYSCIGLHALMSQVAEKFLIDDLRIIGTKPLYRTEVWHNSTQTDDGNINSINATLNFTTNVSDDYSLQIYDWLNSQWINCQSNSVLADTPTKWWCNITSNPMNYNTSDRRVRVRINSTADLDPGLLREDYVQYYVGFPSYLDVNLTNPDYSKPLNVGQNRTFGVNATVICRDGPCGEVFGTVMYNISSPYPDTPVNTTEGDEPFYIKESPANAIKSCGTMYLGDLCQLNWTINATGSVNTGWKIGVLFNSSYTDIKENDTSNATISIFLCTIDFSVDWNVSFGSLSPNTGPIEAPENPNKKYNITVNSGSCDLDFYINGTDLINTTYNSQIEVANMTWSNTSNTYSESFNLSHEIAVLKLGVSQNMNVTTWYWINVPPVYAGYYVGSIYLYGVEHDEPPP